MILQVQFLMPVIFRYVQYRCAVDNISS